VRIRLFKSPGKSKNLFTTDILELRDAESCQQKHPHIHIILNGLAQLLNYMCITSVNAIQRNECNKCLM
jgi:hypothetical protein